MELVTEKYKQTDMGSIPRDWEVKPLGNVLQIIGGGAFKSSDAQSLGIRWLKIANVGKNKIVWNEEDYLPSHFQFDFKNFLLNEGDYVLALTRPILDRDLKIARLKKSDAPCLLNQRVGKIENSKGVNIDFIFYLLQMDSIISSLLQSMVGSDPPNLSIRAVYEILCAVPNSESEQTAIATALSDADALINQLEQLLTKKRNIKTGAMQELLRPKEGWVEKTLGEIAVVRDGTHQTPTYVEAGIPFYSVETVTKDSFNNTKFISEEDHKILTKSFRIEKGDILMTRIGSIGDCKLIDWDVNASFYVSLALLKIKAGFSANYVCHYSRTEKFKREADYNSLQSAVPRKINLGPISNLKIDLPDYEEQTRIAQILSDMDNEIEELEKQVEKYKMLKQGMMQSLLTGKIRLV